LTWKDAHNPAGQPDPKANISWGVYF